MRSQQLPSGNLIMHAFDWYRGAFHFEDWYRLVMVKHVEEMGYTRGSQQDSSIVSRYQRARSLEIGGFLDANQPSGTSNYLALSGQTWITFVLQRNLCR